MLVVLVIVGLIGGLLFTAYERVLDIRIRLAAFLDGTDAPTLIAGWFRGSVDGLVPDQDGGAAVFAGTKDRLSGLSVADFDGTPGVPTPIAWELAFDTATNRTQLRYSSGTAAPLAIASWPGDRGGLQYCDDKLACFNSWPPPGVDPTTAKPPQLPALIVLQAVRGTDPWPIAAAPTAARDALPRQQGFGAPGS
jgi:hypothetical protein